LPGRSYAVCLVHLVDLVYFVYPVDLVHLINLVQPNKQDKPNKPNNSLLTPTIFFYSLLQYKNECADIHVATGIDLLTKFYL
jgi:hypothetical protein